LSAVAVVVAALAQPAAAEFRTPAEGGPGGNPFALRCPSGPWGAFSQTYLIGLKVRLGALMDYVEPICALVHPNSVKGAVRFAYALPDEAMPRPRGAGGQGGKGFYYIDCSSLEQVVTRLRVETMSYIEDGWYKAFVADASVGCLRLTLPKGFDDELRTHRVGAGYKKANYDWLDPLSCPRGQWAVGIHGRAGRYVVRLGLICDAPFQASDPIAVPLPVDPDAVSAGKVFEESVNPNALGSGGSGMFEEGINSNAIGN
jgi:hypothetical protein